MLYEVITTGDGCRELVFAVMDYLEQEPKKRGYAMNENKPGMKKSVSK